ncbi:hypothetical protein [Frigoriglobus tundricola]|uniref:Uncharacterized protein n=1 Tax=Frigoriglobus tundricola TaxID=2774151 RepID=A0A6M5Z1Q2_9BACT|nr:hypothetical protein [Frigoriglobus tundricola]QJX00300.1 hypothetical protein FTUN_7925 [Frigoriglobus tundricola]
MSHNPEKQPRRLSAQEKRRKDLRDLLRTANGPQVLEALRKWEVGKWALRFVAVTVLAFCAVFCALFMWFAVLAFNDMSSLD